MPFELLMTLNSCVLMDYFIAVMNSLDWMNSLIADLLSNLLGMFTFMVLAIFCISLILFSSMKLYIWCTELPGLIAVMAACSFVFLKISLMTALMFLMTTLVLWPKC